MKLRFKLRCHRVRIVQGLPIHFTLYFYLENICSYIKLLQADEFKKDIEDMAARSLRCVAFAYRPFELDNVPSEEQRVNWVLPEDNLILLAIVGIKVCAGESMTIFYCSSVLSHSKLHTRNSKYYNKFARNHAKCCYDNDSWKSSTMCHLGQ